VAQSSRPASLFLLPVGNKILFTGSQPDSPPACTARCPVSGILGRNLFCSPLSVFLRQRINAPVSRQPSSPLRVDASLRPFAHLQRLPGAEPPLQGQCSRPVTSASHRVRSRKPVCLWLLRSTPLRGRLRADSLPQARTSGSDQRFRLP
jgi:hypothetical protein